MHQFCKGPDWRLSGKMVTARSTRHLAGGEKRSKCVYGELYSAVTSTRRATAASHSTPRARGEPSPGDPPAVSLSSAAGIEGGESLLDLSSGAGPEPAARRPTGPLPRETYSVLLHGDAAVTEETGNIPESFNLRAAGVVRAEGCL